MRLLGIVLYVHAQVEYVLRDGLLGRSLELNRVQCLHHELRCNPLVYRPIQSSAHSVNDDTPRSENLPGFIGKVKVVVPRSRPWREERRAIIRRQGDIPLETNW